jgi:hypothetical protein
MDAFSTGFDTDRLAELVSQKYRLLQSVQELVARQEELIERGEMTSLLEVLVVKQRMLDELQTLERRLEPFRHQDPQTRRWRNEVLRQQTAARLQECQKLLADILQREKRCESELLRRREETAEQLRNLCTTSQMLAAYQAVQSVPQNQLDLASGQ